MTPPNIEWQAQGDTLRATPPHATISLEMESPTEVRGLFRWEQDTPISLTVHQPHDRSVQDEACDVFAAIYWSRYRAAFQVAA